MVNTVNLDLGDTRLILAKCREYKLSTHQTAYILATAYWETAYSMKPVEEAYYLGAKASAYRKKLKYYPWHGRGYVQLTHKANYILAGKKLNVDLTIDPTRAMLPTYAATILVLGSMEGWFTTRKLSDYVNDVKVDYINARRVINGTDKAAEIANIAEQYYKALVRENVVEVVAAKPVAKKFSWATFFSNLFKW